MRLMRRSSLSLILLCFGMNCANNPGDSIGPRKKKPSGAAKPKPIENSGSKDARMNAGKDPGATPAANPQAAKSKGKPAKPEVPGTPQNPVPIKRGDFEVYSRGEGGWISGKLWFRAWPFRPEGYAVVWGPSHFTLIDRRENELGYVFSFDNHPDSVQDGLIRMQEGEKIRYFSLKDGVFLKGAWDYGTPFDNGVACVCNDCLQPVGEYHEVRGGVSWFINDKGKVIRPYTNPIPQCDLRHRKDTKEW